MNTTQLFIIFIAIFLVHSVLAEDHPEECETLPSELHIIKGNKSPQFKIFKNAFNL